MFATQITIDTSKFPDVWYFISHHVGSLAAVLAIVGAGVMVSFITELYKRHLLGKLDIATIEAKLKKLVNRFIVVLAALIGAASQVIIFINSHNDTLFNLVNKVPNGAGIMAGVMSAAYFFYNIGGDKRVKAAVDWLGTWSKSSTKIPETCPQSTVPPETPPSRNLLS